jgi:transposase
MLPARTKRDARSLDHATLEEMRRLAVSRVLAGESQVAVGASLQVHPDTVNKWTRHYREHGKDGLTSSKAPGPATKLSDKQIKVLRRLIVGKEPRQLNFGPALWSLPIVAELIERLFDVVLHETTISRMLHRLGITPQRPARRAFQRDDDEIRRWIETDFPAAVREARRMQGTLLFLDETGVHEDAAVGTTWGQRGKTPVVATSGTRRRINAISAISPRGRMWFRCYEGNLNAPRFVQFLEGLLHDLAKPLVLVLDRHPAHRAAVVRRFLQANRARIRVHYLPGYAPELNPDEHVWTKLKSMFKRAPLRAGEDFDGIVHETLESIRSDRAAVRKFLDHPEVAYVKAAPKW